MDGRKIASLLQEGYRMPKPQHADDKLLTFFYIFKKLLWYDTSQILFRSFNEESVTK